MRIVFVRLSRRRGYFSLHEAIHLSFLDNTYSEISCARKVTYHIGMAEFGKGRNKFGTSSGTTFIVCLVFGME